MTVSAPSGTLVLVVQRRSPAIISAFQGRRGEEKHGWMHDFCLYRIGQILPHGHI